MGKHTAYWQRYSRAQVRGALRIAGAIALWILVVVLLALAKDTLSRAFPVLMFGAFAGMAISIVVLARHVYRVTCPECGTQYTRSKWHGQCPTCGLRMLQSDP